MHGFTLSVYFTLKIYWYKYSTITNQYYEEAKLAKIVILYNDDVVCVTKLINTVQFSYVIYGTW